MENANLVLGSEAKRKEPGNEVALKLASNPLSVKPFKRVWDINLLKYWRTFSLIFTIVKILLKIKEYLQSNI